MNECMRTPMKWHKYLLLAHYCLTTRERLGREIRRYSITERARVMQDITHALTVGGDQTLYVIKLVSPDVCGQLPNCRVLNPSDLPTLERFLDIDADCDYTEVWCCPTNMSPFARNLAGRLAFEDGWRGAQTLEQVWRTSPRLLEAVTCPHNDGCRWPYLRAHRMGWGWRFEIEDLFVPRDWTQPASDVEAEAREAMIQVDAERERVETFANMLTKTGVRSFSVEYKIVGAELWFIDWDTPDDSRVMRSLGDLSILL